MKLLCGGKGHSAGPACPHGSGASGKVIAAYTGKNAQAVSILMKTGVKNRQPCSWGTPHSSVFISTKNNLACALLSVYQNGWTKKDAIAPVLNKVNYCNTSPTATKH